jgi:hypothetical protein
MGGGNDGICDPYLPADPDCPGGRGRYHSYWEDTYGHYPEDYWRGREYDRYDAYDRDHDRDRYRGHRRGRDRYNDHDDYDNYHDDYDRYHGRHRYR